MTAITVVLGALITFLLTGVCGNWLISKWQQRNWLNQHKFLSLEKDLQELQSTINLIAALGDARNYRMRLLVRALRDGDKSKIQVAREQCDKSVADWNDNFNSIFNKLTIYASYEHYALRFEEELSDNFFRIGSKIGAAEKAGSALSVSDYSKFESELNRQSGRICILCRDLLNEYQKKKKVAYEGVQIKYSEDVLPKLSTLQLFQFLFKRPQQF